VAYSNYWAAWFPTWTGQNAFKHNYTSVQSGSRVSARVGGLLLSNGGDGAVLIESAAPPRQMTAANDAWIAGRIQAMVGTDIDAKARDLRISSDQGVVTLSGHAKSANAAASTIRTAINTPGVTAVRSQLVF
jgi:osmotically-inducible protein OsmY